MKYYVVSEGEWVQPIRKGYKMACCDCGLCHTVNLRVRKGKIQIQAFRDNRASANMRRASGVKLIRERTADTSGR